MTTTVLPKALIAGALALLVAGGVVAPSGAANAMGNSVSGETSQTTVPLIVRGPQGAYFGFTGQNAPTGASIAYVNPQLEPVQSAAVAAEVPALGTSGAVRIAGETCLAVAGRLIAWQPCADTDEQRWTVSDEGALQPSRGGILATQSRIGVVPVGLGAVSTGWRLLAVAPQADFTAAASFAAVTRANATVVGTARPGAEVQVWLGDERIAQGEAQAMSGAFSIEIPAPNAAGVFEYRVVEAAEGDEDAAELGVSLDYGAAVTVDQIERDGTGQASSALVTGSGQAGGEIAIALNGATASPVVARVDAEGRWERRVQLQSSREVPVRVSQVARGNNLTVAETVVAAVPDVAPSGMQVTAPVESAIVATDPVTFTGVTAPNQRVELRSLSSGALLGRTFADASGSWAVDVNKTLGNGSYRIQVVSGTEIIVRSFRVALVRESSVVVESPTLEDATAAGVVVFSGTAKPNAAVALRSLSSEMPLGDTIADESGAWSLTVNKQLAPGNYVVGVVSEGLTKRYAFRLVG